MAAIGVLMAIIAIVVGMLSDENYWAPMLIIFAYLVALLIVLQFFKHKNSYKLRMSHFLISVFCRAENNRLYLRKGVEVRPGFTGKWIEFNCLPS